MRQRRPSMTDIEGNLTDAYYAVLTGVYDSQITSPEGWAKVSLNLVDEFSDKPDKMCALFEAVRKILNNAECAQGRKELGDLVHETRDRIATEHTYANWNKLTEVEREP